MSNYVCMIITMLYGDELLKVALNVCRDDWESDVFNYPMEPENRETLLKMLPEYCAVGPIVAVDMELFALVNVPKINTKN